MKSSSPDFRSLLLADDDPDDRLLFRDALDEINVRVDLQTVINGDELMDYLLNSAVMLPDLLFLDLNMPGKNGFRCLDEIRHSNLLKHLDVIIYSTSNNPGDIESVYRKGANLFICKPNSFTDLKEILSHLFNSDLRQLLSARNPAKFVFNAMR